MKWISNIVFVITILAAFAFGFFIYRFPLKAFEIQKKFYALINWRIEPISLEKEIRNTKGMGLFLMAVVLAAVCYFWVNMVD